MRRFLWAAFTVAVLLIILIGVMYAYIEWFGGNCQPQRADAIIVLGAAVWKDGPSPALLERIELAETLYKQGYATAIITTGGVGSFNPVPEGRAAKTELVRRGIPAGAICEEVYSRDTGENLRGALEIMKKYGWRRAIIVTHDFHLFRAVMEAKKLGMEVTGAGVHRTAMVRAPMVMREVIATLAGIIGY